MLIGGLQVEEVDDGILIVVAVVSAAYDEGGCRAVVGVVIS